MKALLIIGALLLAGCSSREESTLNSVKAINDFCKKNSGELTTSIEGGFFGPHVKFSCTARVSP